MTFLEMLKDGCRLDSSAKDVIYIDGKKYVRCGYCGKFEENCDKIRLNNKPICIDCYEKKADEYYENFLN